MDNNFQTSFIPKKPLAEERVPREKSVNIFSFLATIIFFTSLVTAGGVYFYKIVLTKQVATMSDQLNIAKEAYDPNLITELQNLDKRINASEEILSNHIALSPLFKSLQQLTLKTIRFTKFDYSVSTENSSNINVKMTGTTRGNGYEPIALQAELLKKNKYIKDPVFSNLNLDDRGGVTFDLVFTVDRSFLSYTSGINQTVSRNTSESNTN